MAIQREEQLDEVRIFNIWRRIMKDESNPFELKDDLFEVFQDNKRNDPNIIAVLLMIQFFDKLNFYATWSYQSSLGQKCCITFSQPVALR